MYEPGHDCRKKKLFVMIGEEAIETVQSEEELGIVWDGNDAEQSHKYEDVAAKVSIQAMNGSMGNGTIMLQGIIQGHQVNILVDSGSTHDFISYHLAKLLRLKASPCPPFNVTIADGNQVQCSTSAEPVIGVCLEKSSQPICI